MRYGPEHKDETRLRVLKAAAAAIRSHGPEGVSVADIMRSAGLTHGGFYAHFNNKDDLVAQAVGEMFAQGRRRFGRVTDGLPPAQALAAFVDRYVSTDHRDHPEQGCPLTSMAGDIARQARAREAASEQEGTEGAGTARAAFDAGVAALIGRLAEWLPEDAVPREVRAASLLAEMAGALALSRAVSDPVLSAQLLQACRSSVLARTYGQAAPALM